jgi:hypothetical protein
MPSGSVVDDVEKGPWFPRWIRVLSTLSRPPGVQASRPVLSNVIIFSAIGTAIILFTARFAVGGGSC